MGMALLDNVPLEVGFEVSEAQAKLILSPAPMYKCLLFINTALVQKEKGRKEEILHKL